MIKMTFTGRDDLFRPVYTDPEGRLWMDTDPRAHVPVSLYTVEEQKPFHGKAKFVPKRVTW